jgi:RNA polymerase subunit RPABC4/transcription elongation factor Spt4
MTKDCVCANCKHLLRADNEFPYCKKHTVEVFDWDYCGDWEVEDE